MKVLSKLKSNQGHGKNSYLIEISEIEVFALQKFFSGKKVKKGAPVHNAIKSFKEGINSVDIKMSIEEYADLFNPLKRYEV